MENLKKQFNKKAADLKKEVRKNKMDNEEKDDFKCRTINEKLCPLMSNAKYQVACTPQCKLYRAGVKKYECYFMALETISWNTKK